MPQPTVEPCSVIRDAYTEHRAELINFLIRRFGVARSEGEDIVQSAFAQFSKEVDVASVHNVRAYLFKVCTNLTIDSQRRTKVRDGYRQRVLTLQEKASYDINPASAVDSTKKLGLIAKAMWRMPKKRRKLLIMNRFDGLSYAEISRQVGLSESVVRKHIARALDDCQVALGGSEEVS